MDTRNRYQRIFTARYDNATVKPREVNKRFKCQTELMQLNRLSDENNHTKRHPRTHQLIRFQTSDVRKFVKALKTHLNSLPRTTFQRKQNAVSGRITTTIKDGKIISCKVTREHESVATWKSIWYSRNNRRK